MSPKQELEMWEKLHPKKYNHFDHAREVANSWPKWKREVAYSSSSDCYIETDSGSRYWR